MSECIFYKAVRPDGTDFRTGTIRYEVGQTVTPAPTDLPARICGPGMLHAATVPAMTLVSGSWPCRLFEVTGTPVAGLDDEHPHKAGFRSLIVVREVEAWQALGRNGREVAALIDRAGRLTSDETRRLAAARVAARVAAQEAAREAARVAARDAARDAAWAAAQAAAWDAAWAAAWAAATALVVRDLITPEQFDVLYGPWASVIEAGA